MSKTNLKIILLSVIVCIVLFSTFISLQKVYAADLTDVKDRMNRMEDSLTSGVEHNLIWTQTTSTVAGNDGTNVTMRFPDADDGLWCRTAGALGVSGITSDPAHSGVINDPDTGGNALSATCTQGAGAASYDTITITNVDDLGGATTYGINIDDSGAGALGTPTTATTGVVLVTVTDGAVTDTGYLALDIVDDDTVTVTATVEPILECSLDTTSVAFGNVTPNAGAASGTNNDLDMALETNATNGYAWVVYDEGNGTNPGLYDSSTTSIIGSADDTYANTANLSASTEGYGIFMTDPDGGGGAAVVDGRYDGGATNDVGGFEVGTDNSIAAIVDTAATSGSESSNVTFVVNINSSTPIGDYTDDVTFVCVGKF